MQRQPNRKVPSLDFKAQGLRNSIIVLRKAASPWDGGMSLGEVCARTPFIQNPSAWGILRGPLFGYASTHPREVQPKYVDHDCRDPKRNR